MRRILIIVLSVVVLLSAAGGAYAYVNGRWISDSDLAVITVGGTHEVRLPANISTGYSWKATYDESVLELVEDRYEQPSGGTPGAGGTQVLVFRGLAAGTTTVILDYARPWEGVPLETREITFEVQ